MYPVLIVLSRLRPAAAQEDPLLPGAFVPAIMSCCAARPLASRRWCPQAMCQDWCQPLVRRSRCCRWVWQ
jgi:hypothetical protein